MMTSILDHVPDHVLDHTILGHMTTALQNALIIIILIKSFKLKIWGCKSWEIEGLYKKIKSKVISW